MTDRAEGKERPAAGSGGVSWARRVRLWLVWFVGLNAVWLVLISAFVLEETLLGILASAVAATAALAVGEQRPFRFRPRARWVLAAWRLPFDALRESGLVLGAPPTAGRPARKERGPLPGGACVAAGRPGPRAQTKAGAADRRPARCSLNRNAVNVDREAGTMLVHELAPKRTDDGRPGRGPVLLCRMAPLILFAIRATPPRGWSRSTSAGRSRRWAGASRRGHGPSVFFDLAVVSAVLSFGRRLGLPPFLERRP